MTKSEKKLANELFFAHKNIKDVIVEIGCYGPKKKLTCTIYKNNSDKNIPYQYMGQDLKYGVELYGENQFGWGNKLRSFAEWLGFGRSNSRFMKQMAEKGILYANALHLKEMPTNDMMSYFKRSINRRKSVSEEDKTKLKNQIELIAALNTRCKESDIKINMENIIKDKEFYNLVSLSKNLERRFDQLKNSVKRKPKKTPTTIEQK